MWMQCVTASLSACVRPAASQLRAPVRAGAPGLSGGSDGKDQRGGEGVETRLLLCGDVPPPLLLALNEPVLEKHMALVIPRGKGDAAAGRGGSWCPPGVCS